MWAWDKGHDGSQGRLVAGLGWAGTVPSGLMGGSGLLGQVLERSSLRLEGAGDKQAAEEAEASKGEFSEPGIG